MLELKKISKVYETGELKQVALDNVSLNFRDNEFVSILGPSGSGKTTLLNIIGGLDKYDKGDLIINNISTKKYKSKDWDSYRNHTIGFVFQSYNLIPHQTILANVELALTISGVSKSERKKRALDALSEVGLKKQAHKKPNQLSGGQMQRVAVARALVNNPDILLADEPTGALDSETSLQVMELLAKIAKDRLVIMVTHNPELAEKYSTRIVRLMDGEIIDDSNVYKVTKNTKVEKYKNLGKSSMSIPTAFGLSLNNLLTKKARTILTSFAGSIGIIGIALILSLSNGFQKYIDKVQEDALTSYPLTIESETADTANILLSAISKNEDEDENNDGITESKNIENMFSSVGKNDMKSFKEYIEANNKIVNTLTKNINMGYSITPYIYTRNINNKIERINPSSVLSSLMVGMDSSMMTMSVFQELINNDKMLENNYKVLSGSLPKKYDEVVIILPDEKHISDLLLYSLGLKDSSNLDKMMSQIISGEKITGTGEPNVYRYEDLMEIELKLVDNADVYKYNQKYNMYEDMSEDEEYISKLYTNATKLKVVGIIQPKDTSGMSSLASGVGYTKSFTEYVINKSLEKEIVQKQLENKNINVFSGKSFDDKSNETGIDFDNLISVDTNMLSSAFNINIDNNYIENVSNGYMDEISSAISADNTSAKNMFLDSLNNIFKGMLSGYISNNQITGMEGIALIRLDDVDGIVDSYMDSAVVNETLKELETNYIIPADTYKTMYSEIIKVFLKSYISLSSTYEDNSSFIATNSIDDLTSLLLSNEEVTNMSSSMANKMVEALSSKLISSVASSFKVDENKIAKAFKFNLSEDDIKRLFSAASSNTVADATTNLVKLGYQDIDSPTTISFYFKDFDSKEKFISFLEDYNSKMKKEDENKVIEYTDLTGLIISSVKVIVDSVSYVLIAFVSISLIVSSIMIGIITYISVLERTKEIGILRAIGASKRNISSIFNAETFIVGLLSGVIGVGVSLLLLIPINYIIHTLTNNINITAVLPLNAGIVLIFLSTILTLIGGLIPSRKAAKKDPVLALRSE